MFRDSLAKRKPLERLKDRQRWRGGARLRQFTRLRWSASARGCPDSGNRLKTLFRRCHASNRPSCSTTPHGSRNSIHQMPQTPMLIAAVVLVGVLSCAHGAWSFVSTLLCSRTSPMSVSESIDLVVLPIGTDDGQEYGIGALVVVRPVC